LRNRSRRDGRGARKRRVWRGTISLFCLPLMLVGGETVLALHQDARLYSAMMEVRAAAGLGLCYGGPGESSVVTYYWDDDGNMTRRSCQIPGKAAEDQLFEYDAENRLTRTYGVGGGDDTHYIYDPWGVRRRKIVNGTETTMYVVDRERPYAQVVAERVEGVSGVDPYELALYTYGDDLLSRTGGIEIDGSTVSFANADSRHYHYDGQMSTRQLTDDGDYASSVAPQVTDTYAYDAFGVMLDQQAPATGIDATDQPYLYNGEQFDAAADAYYLRARYYSQGVGRFISADPFDGYRSELLSNFVDEPNQAASFSIFSPSMN